MKTAYTDTNLNFMIESRHIDVLNIVFERFTRTIPAHSHGNGCYEVHFIPYGYGKVKADGRYYDITPGTLYVTGPHVEHAQTPQTSDPMQEYCIYFKLASSGRGSAKRPSPVMDAFTATPFWIGQDTQGIQELMIRLFRELEQRQIGYRKQVELLLSQLIVALVRNYEQCSAKPGPTAPQGEFADNKSRIIEEYFLYEYQSLSLGELSSRLNLSPRQTQRLLLEYYGKNFQEKKTEARMSVAALLLSDNSHTVSDIADALGYSSPEHFSNAFRKYYQLSPSAYRRDIHSKDPSDTLG